MPLNGDIISQLHPASEKTYSFVVLGRIYTPRKRTVEPHSHLQGESLTPPRAAVFRAEAAAALFARL